MQGKLSLCLKGVEAEIVHHAFRGVMVKTLLVRLRQKRRVLNTLEGLREVAFIANHYIPEALWDYVWDHRDEYRRWLLEDLGVTSEELTFLWTGVDVENVAVVSRSFEELAVVVLVTAGVGSNAQRLGEDEAGYLERCGVFERIHGTINVILLTNARLTEGAMIRSLINITEAKTAALEDLDVRSSYTPLQNQATGTGTDNAIVVPGDGPEITCVGGHTVAGQLIGRVTKEGVKEAIRRQNGLFAHRGIVKRLAERGISVEEMVSTATSMYVPDPSIGTEQEVSERIRQELLKVLEDPNVAALLLAALKLEEAGGRGAIPRITVDRYRSDPVELVADEILGLQIAQYIGGSRALFEFYRWDRQKPGLLASLPPFLDDALGGLLAGVMVKVCS